MTHLATWHRARAVAALLLVLPLAAGSCRTAVIGKVPPGNVIPEDEDEQALRPPGSLGGPGHGRVSKNPKVRATPALDDFIENLTDAQLVDYLSQLQYDMGDRSESVSAACVHNPTGHPHPIPAPKRCNFGDGAAIAIEPEVGMNQQDYAAIPEHGLVVARIINYETGDKEELTFGFPPNRRVWWVVDKPKGVVRSRFFIRNYSATAPAVTQIRDAAAVYPLVNCHPEETHQHAEATFATCSRAPHLTVTPARSSAASPSVPQVGMRPLGARMAFSSAVPIPKATEMVIDGTWVTCRGGCCATSP